MKKRVMVILIVLLMSVQICACGSNSVNGMMASETMSFVSDDYAYREGSGLAPAYADNNAASEEISVKSESSIINNNSDKIIYSANVTLETMEFDKTLSGIDSLIQEYNCYIESSSTNGADLYDISRGYKSTRSASYTIRVPAESFDKLISSLSSIGNIPYKTVYTENVSDEYYDSQARLNNYKAQEERLVELLEEANSVSDIIEIENKLSEVRYNIESLQTKLNNLDNKVAYSTLYLSVDEVSEYVEYGDETFGQKIKEALKEGFDVLEDVVVFLIGALPVIILATLLTIAVVAVIKKIKKIRKNKKEKTEVSNQ